MKICISVTALLFCTVMVNCQRWKVIHVSQNHTEVKVENCTDPHVYLQFKDPITVMLSSHAFNTCFQKIPITSCENMSSRRRICVNGTCLFFV